MSKIAIISDSHDNIPNLEKFLEYCKKNKIKTLLHCGDITSLETFNYIQDHFDGDIYAVRGNADMFTLNKIQIIEIASLKIAMSHHKETAVRLMTKENNPDFIFYGHSHKPWIEKFENAYLANPGSLAGMGYKAAFAILDTKTKKIELKILEGLMNA